MDDFGRYFIPLFVASVLASIIVLLWKGLDLTKRAYVEGLKIRAREKAAELRVRQTESRMRYEIERTRRLEAQAQNERDSAAKYSAKKEYEEARTRLAEARKRNRKSEIVLSPSLGSAADSTFDETTQDSVFVDLEPHLKQAKIAFRAAAGSYDNFRKSLNAEPLRHPALKAIKLLGELIAHAPNDTPLLPQTYTESVSVRPLRLFSDIENILSTVRPHRTDSLLQSLYFIANILRNSEALTTQMNERDQLRFFDVSMSCAMLIHDALCYQLIQFQFEIIKEHLASDQEMLAAEGAVAAIDSLIKELDREINGDDEDLQTPSSLFEMQRQRLEMINAVCSQAKYIRDEILESARDIATLNSEVVERFHELLKSKRNLLKIARQKDDPSIRFGMLLRVGESIGSLVPDLAASMGFRLTLSGPDDLATGGNRMATQ